MKYFLIVGEASGDLHAAHLMQELRQADPQAEFFFYGGDEMKQAGGTLLQHYKATAYMGFIPVLTHLPAILRHMRDCKRHLCAIRPDVVILVDYPGFNLKMADYAHNRLHIPVFYYISPKIWAWKEHRIKLIRRDVDELFSILPFEKSFFEDKHHFPIHYVGNPTVDEVEAFRRQYAGSTDGFRSCRSLSPGQPLIALLAGSRVQEVRDNLRRMCLAAAPYVAQGYRLVVAGAPSLSHDTYERILATLPGELREQVYVVHGETYPLLARAEAALVTSGTATLETALFNVPQVVCYYTSFGRAVSWLRRLLLKVPYVSLVNLICREEVVPELVADGMTVDNVRRHLGDILPGGVRRAPMLDGYARMRTLLGGEGASRRAARLMVDLLRQRR